MKIKKITCFLLALSLLSACQREEGLILDGPQPSFNLEASAAIPGELLINLPPGASPQSMRDRLNRFNVRFSKRSESLGFHHVLIPREMAPEEMAAQLVSEGIVPHAEPNTRIMSAFKVNDPDWGQQSGLDVIKIDRAWDVTRGDPKVVVAVADTGIDFSHPDLEGQTVAGFNALNDGQSPARDDNGHGTHVSGIIAAKIDNKTGIAGIAPRCKIMPIKILDAEGSGDLFSLIKGISWAVDHGAKVINVSLGGPRDSGEGIRRAIRYAAMKDVVVVAAMANNGFNGTDGVTDKQQFTTGQNIKSYPAAYSNTDGVIAVGAIDNSQRQAYLSNWGDWLTIMAPGIAIYSTLPYYGTEMTEIYGEGYGAVDGTSMATPIVSGLVALMRTVYPKASAKMIKEKLISTAIDLGEPGFDERFGHGMINPGKAVR